MSNLTSASGEASVSSGNRNETNYPPQQYFAHPPPPQSQPPAKKKRNLPGNPDPDAEVIALSPKTLMATNRFVCEICNKGFQRDQNLQLHRRGHNLPWKLKQRTNKEVIRKKVYVCPETSCVHHDPSRALGDLTGIKKHFSRKHGEKKWKCDKCSKRYAVQSDWKAHSKTCGTREYRCDCGTLFSRRDSFITHRAFCDALAEESARAITDAPNPLLIPSNQSAAAASSATQNPISLHQVPQLMNSHQNLHAFSLKKEQQTFSTTTALRPELPPWLACPPGVLGSGSGHGPGPPHHQQTPIEHHHLSSSILNFQQDLGSSNPNPSLGPTLPHYQAAPPPSPHMSATALLQKAAQMGATMSSKTTTAGLMMRPHQHQHQHEQAHVTADSTNNNANTTGFVLNLSSRDQELAASGGGGSFVHSLQAAGANGVLLQEMMNSLSSAASGFEGTATATATSFEDAFVSGVLNNSKKDGNFLDGSLSKATTNGNNGGEDLTRDFLGLRAFSHSDILNMAAGLGNCVNTSHEQQQQNQSQKTWRG
ncbi:protein indeterminate-domain 7 isoform X2 [Ricinus communis]|nr:protein indeterminate-domain 7 isoform X2 [Ricinus communis]